MKNNTITDRIHEDMAGMSEAELFEMVVADGYNIQFIEDPSEALCMAAVTHHSLVIYHIQNPSEAVCLAAVKQNGYAVSYIKNPSEEVKLAAVNNQGRAIKYIQNPSEAVCMAAVSQNGCVIGELNAKNPSEAVQAQAVKSSHEAIAYLRPVTDTIVAVHLIHHPLSPYTPKEILDRAPEILDNHCSGLGDVYTLGLSMNMNGKELSKTIIEWVERHAGATADAEMAP